MGKMREMMGRARVGSCPRNTARHPDVSGDSSDLTSEDSAY